MTDFWKNKKIISYVALSHHTRFITPVMELLKSRGAHIKYIVGQAERSQEITAIELGLEYSHVFDYISDKDREEIMENYHLLGDIFGESLKQDFILGILPVTVHDKTLFSTAAEYIGFKNLLEKEKPDLCFALHELNRWGKMLAFWAKKKNIPFISLQEGLSYNLDFGYSGHAQYSTLNLTWGDRVKEKMVSFEAPESKIIPVGNTHLAMEINHQIKNKIRETKRKKYKISDQFVTLLILSVQLPVPDLLRSILKTVSKNNNQRLFIKFHPACKKSSIDKWTKGIPDQFKKNSVFIHAQESTYDLISVSDVVLLGHKSTTGLETLAFGKPLIKLDFAYKANSPYSFVDQGVAMKMRAEEFAEALSLKTDFAHLMDKDKVDQYLKHELKNVTTAIQTVCTIFENSIHANKTQVQPIPIAPTVFEKKWSIVIQAPDSPEIFLAQLEAVAVNSKDSGTYETLILLPEKTPQDINEIIDSLEGDLKLLKWGKDQNKIDILNSALEKAEGENLIFLEKNLAPLKNWLKYAGEGFSTHGQTRVLGSRISDKEGKIANAGMVVDQNHTPVPAYHHLEINFENALKERSFQMVDYFIAVKKELFFQVGGFSPEAGEYKFLDFCLKVQESTQDPKAIIYLPDLKMIFLAHPPQKANTDDAVYFYGKWNGALWETDKKLQQEDGVSPKDMTHAKLASAIKTFR